MRKLIALLAVCFVMGAFASGAMAVTVEVDEVSGSSSGVDVPITVSDPTNIAGAAFTLEYDTDAIEITEVSSTFFDTFVNQGFTQADGLDANNMVDGYASPLVENYISASGMKISAARKDGASSGSATTLFTLRVRLKNGSEGVDYPIEIVKTELSNTSAGYSASGEEIPVLYDVDAGGNIGSMSGTVLTDGSVTFTVPTPPVVIEHSYEEGLNLVPFTATGSGIINASDLEDKIESENSGLTVVQIFGWDAQNQRFTSAYIASLGLNDFGLTEGASYFVQTSGQGNLSIEGNDYGSLPLFEGLNLLGVPDGRTDITEASDLADDIASKSGLTVVQIFGWDPENQRFTSAYIHSLSINDFELASDTMGYFVQVSGDGTYYPY